MSHVDAPRHDERGRLTIIADSARAVSESAGHPFRDSTRPSRRDHGWSTEGTRKALRKGKRQTLGLAQSERDTLRAESLLHRIKLRRNRLQGLVPGDPLPLAFAARSNSLLRIQQ